MADLPVRFGGQSVDGLPARALASLLMGMTTRPELWTDEERDAVVHEVVRRLLGGLHV